MKQSVVTPEGITIDYFSFGENNRPFVILPGIDTQSVVNSAAAVAAAYRPIAAHYTVYVFDRRRDMPSPYSVWDMARDTAAAAR